MKDNIITFMDEYNIDNYIINDDMTVDINGDIDISGNDIIDFPFKFNRVIGDFDCSNNLLTSLKNIPNYISGSCYLFENNLTSIDFMPEIGDNLSLSFNYLTSLKGCPKRVNGSFYCGNNKLLSLRGCPEYVGGYFGFICNKVSSLRWICQTGTGYFMYRNFLPNEIYDNEDIIKYIINNQDKFLIWNDDDTFNDVNFKKLIDSIND